MEINIEKKENKKQSKEYQIPELVDLHSISESMGGLTCGSGSSGTV